MSAPLNRTCRLALFERPGADFVLRRSLEMLLKNQESSIQHTMGMSARFVLVVPVVPSGIRCIHANTLEEVPKALKLARGELQKSGFLHFQLDMSVEPETHAPLDQILEEIEFSVRPPAANDP